MATNATWVVVFEDKTVIKNIDEGANEGIGYAIDDNTFWNQSKFWIQQKFEIKELQPKKRRTPKKPVGVVDRDAVVKNTIEERLKQAKTKKKQEEKDENVDLSEMKLDLDENT